MWAYIHNHRLAWSLGTAEGRLSKRSINIKLQTGGKITICSKYLLNFPPVLFPTLLLVLLAILWWSIKFYVSIYQSIVTYKNIALSQNLQFCSDNTPKTTQSFDKEDGRRLGPWFTIFILNCFVALTSA